MSLHQPPPETPRVSETPAGPPAAAEEGADPAAPPREYDLYSWSAKSPDTRLLYLRDVDATNAAISQLHTTCLGFDLEWKPNFVKGSPENPVALIQLASEDTILLIHISAMPTFPEKLKELLLDESVVKTGVGIQKDCKKLWADYRVDVRNCVDLSLLARTVDNARWKGKYANPIGLARLCQAYEDLTLYKGKVQISNWERILDEQQQEYAANDCHAGLVLYTRLAAMVPATRPEPLPTYYTFDVYNGYLYHPSSLGTLWHPFNPYYDPGPPPPPRVPKPEENAQGMPGAPGFVPSQRGRPNRYYGRQGRHQRQLSPAAADFVPGAATHTPSPPPSFGGPYAPAPHSLRREPVVPMMHSDVDGYPRLISPRPQHGWRPRAFQFRDQGPPARGRGRGRGGYPIAA